MIPMLLLLPIPRGRLRVFLAVLFPISRIRVPPFLLAGAHVSRIRWIVPDSVAVVITASLSLALRLTTNALLGSIDRGGGTTAGSTGNTGSATCVVLFSSDVHSQNLQGKQIAPTIGYRIYVEFLPRPCRRGQKG